VNEQWTGWDGTIWSSVTDGPLPMQTFERSLTYCY